MITRRDLLYTLAAAPTAGIDRRALVQRHNPVITSIDPKLPSPWETVSSPSPPTSPGSRRSPIHTMRASPLHPNPNGAGTIPHNPEGDPLEQFDIHGRTVRYATDSTARTGSNSSAGTPTGSTSVASGLTLKGCSPKPRGRHQYPRPLERHPDERVSPRKGPGEGPDGVSPAPI